MSKEVDVLVVGASGFLGSHLFSHYAKTKKTIGTYSKTKIPGFEYLDITQPTQLEIFLLENRPQFIFWVSGNKNVNELESDSNLAEKINTQPILSLIHILKKTRLKTRLIFFSTDYVFSGKKGSYQVEDQTDPVTNYGRSKVSAEKALSDSGIDFKIIRTSAIMGKKGNFFDWAVSSVKNEGPLEAFSNTYFTPTPIEVILQACDRLLKNWTEIPDKILNICYPQKLSRFELVSEIKACVAGSKAQIKAIEADLSRSTIPHDLSLVASKLVSDLKLPSLSELLKKELLR